MCRIFIAGGFVQLISFFNLKFPFIVVLIVHVSPLAAVNLFHLRNLRRKIKRP